MRATLSTDDAESSPVCGANRTTLHDFVYSAQIAPTPAVSPSTSAQSPRRLHSAVLKIPRPLRQRPDRGTRYHQRSRSALGSFVPIIPPSRRRIDCGHCPPQAAQEALSEAGVGPTFTGFHFIFRKMPLRMSHDGFTVQRESMPIPSAVTTNACAMLIPRVSPRGRKPAGGKYSHTCLATSQDSVSGPKGKYVQRPFVGQRPHAYQRGSRRRLK